MSDLRTPLSRVRHLGSAKGGTHHWWMQRLTAVALVPLFIWLAVSVIKLAGADYGTVKAWMGTWPSLVMLTLLVVLSFHHGQLGLQVVIEDYVHVEWQKIVLVVAVKFAAAVIGLIGIVALLRIGFGG